MKKKTLCVALLFAVGFVAVICWRLLSPEVDAVAVVSELPMEEIPDSTKSVEEIVSPITLETEKELVPEKAAELAQKIMDTIVGNNSAESAKRLDASNLWDASLPLKVRRQIAWMLVRSSDPSDFINLTDYLSSADGDSRIKALILESMGESANPDARGVILSALESDDEQVVRGALRGLAKMNNPEDVGRLADLLLSDDASIGLRAEAAWSLGALSSPKATEQLMAAYQNAEVDDELLREVAIEGLGRRNIAETDAFFRQVLSTETDSDVRVSVIEAVSEADGDTDPFLKDFAVDSDSEVRAESIWNLGMLDEGDDGDFLCEQLKNETDSEVRKRLYEALDGQDTIDVPLVLQESLKETDVETQLAAYTLVATHLVEIKDPVERESAEIEVAAEFERMAVESKTLNQRLRAVIGLRRMKTEGASAALLRIVGQSEDPRVITATGIDLTIIVTE